jgi:hypothetical protein
MQDKEATEIAMIHFCITIALEYLAHVFLEIFEL